MNKPIWGSSLHRDGLERVRHDEPHDDARASADFHISDLPTFGQDVKKKMRGAGTFADRLRLRFIKAYVRTDDGKTFRVKLSPEVREVLSGRAR